MNTPRSVLFVCNDNAVFSPLAKAIVRQYGEGKIAVAACGLVTDELNPFAFGIAEEVGLSLIPHTPQLLNAIDPRDYELAVVFTPDAAGAVRALYLDHGLTPRIEFWGMANPAETEGGRRELVTAFRHCRDQIKEKIQTRFAAVLPKY